MIRSWPGTVLLVYLNISGYVGNAIIAYQCLSVRDVYHAAYRKTLASTAFGCLFIILFFDIKYVFEFNYMETAPMIMLNLFSLLMTSFAVFNILTMGAFRQYFEYGRIDPCIHWSTLRPILVGVDFIGGSFLLIGTFLGIVHEKDWLLWLVYGIFGSMTLWKVWLVILFTYNVIKVARDTIADDYFQREIRHMWKINVLQVLNVGVLMFLPIMTMVVLESFLLRQPGYENMDTFLSFAALFSACVNPCISLLIEPELRPSYT